MVVRGLFSRTVLVTRIATVVLAVACAGSGRRAAVAAPAPAGAPDEDLNSKGVALRLAGNNRAALEPFQKAYDLTHSPRATAQLGLVYQSLGRWELAEPLVAKALQSHDDAWVRKYEAELGRALEVIRNHVAHVELVSDPSQAEVVVNGAVAVRLPLSEPVTVAAGQVDLEFRAPGYRNAVRTLTVKSYQYERVFVRLERESRGSAEKATAIAPSAADATNPSGSSSDVRASAGGAASSAGSAPSGAGVDARRLVKWTSLGLAGAALGTGIVATAIHSSSVEEFRSAHGGGCLDDGGRAVDGAGNPVPDCQGALTTYRNARVWQWIGFVGAGVFAATWLVLQLTEPDEHPSTSAAAGTARATAWVCLPSPMGTSAAAAACALRF
jgi:hypothetical protein